MIKAFQAGFIKYDAEESKRKGHYLIIEMSIQSMPHIHLMVIGKDGLISAHLLDHVTEITGYHRYHAKDHQHLGAGDLKALDTAVPKGMLEGLSEQMGFNYTILANSFGEGLLRLTS